MRERMLTVLGKHAPDLCRECGMLWLVFSILDRLIANTITAGWVVSNLTASVAAWLVGIYIEARDLK